MKTNLEEFLFTLDTLYEIGDNENAMRMLEAIIGEYIAYSLEGKGIGMRCVGNEIRSW